MKNSRIVLFALALLGLTSSGCVVSQSTSYKDVERVRVTFASERAGRLFYETLNRLPKRQRDETNHMLVLVVVNVQRKTVTGPNRFFNDAVQRCDTDRDGIITEDEASIFAASVKSDKVTKDGERSGGPSAGIEIKMAGADS